MMPLRSPQPSPPSVPPSVTRRVQTDTAGQLIVLFEVGGMDVAGKRTMWDVFREKILSPPGHVAVDVPVLPRHGVPHAFTLDEDTQQRLHRTFSGIGDRLIRQVDREIGVRQRLAERGFFPHDTGPLHVNISYFFVDRSMLAARGAIQPVRTRDMSGQLIILPAETELMRHHRIRGLCDRLQSGSGTALKGGPV